MNGPLAQMTSLICHGNATLRGLETPVFFPDNSTSVGCEQIRFVETKSNIFGKEKEIIVASSPDLWISELRNRGILGLKLSPIPGGVSGAVNFKSAMSIGGPGGWTIEALMKKNVSEFWQPRWKIADQEANEKTWRVTYNMIRRERMPPAPLPDMEKAKINFRDALVEIREFAEPHEQCLLFGVCFVKALRALDDPGIRSSYFEDLSPPGVLGKEAGCLMSAAMNAWVFGGTESWNNLKFERELRPQYETLSNNLFKTINEAIEAAMADTMPRADNTLNRQISA